MLEYQLHEESMQYADEYQNEINDYNPDNKKCQDLISSLQNKTAELSYSWMKEMLKSPAHFLAYKVKEYTPPNDSMILGSMVDCLITEPANFHKNFVVISKTPSAGNQTIFANAVIQGSSIEEAFNLAYKRGKAEEIYEELKEYIEAVRSNKTTTTLEKYNEAIEIAEKLKNNESVIVFLEQAKSFQEKSILNYEGWKIKRFTDVKTIVDNYHITADLKLMSRLNPDFISNEVFKMNYDLQGAIYTQDNMDLYINICYDENGNIIISEYDQSTLSYGQDKLDYILRCIDECCANPALFSQSYNFHDTYNEKLGIKTKRIYKPNYAKSYRN